MTPTCCPTSTSILITTARWGARLARDRGGFAHPIWCAATYVAVPRQDDGVWTWRRTAAAVQAGSRSGSRPSDRYEAEVAAAAAAGGLPYARTGRIRHGQPVLPG